MSARNLERAGVPADLHAQALEALTIAKREFRGLTLAKWRVRLFKAEQIAKLLPWDAERLIDVRPDLAAWDVAPVVNVTAHGDNAPWVMTPDGGRPAPGRWLNPDPHSAEYAQGVASNYWCKGEHPRSQKSRKAWYRRNAGEYVAWQRGCPIDLSEGRTTWSANGVTVHKSGNAWQVITKYRRDGYELDNLWADSGELGWYPIPGHELRAPVSWTVIPWPRKTNHQPASAGFFTPGGTRDE